MTDSERLRVQDLADRHGVTLSDIVDFQDQGFLRPGRDRKGPYFSAGDEVRLQIALKGKRLGFTMREIIVLIATAATMSSGAIVAHAKSICQICLSAGATCLPQVVKLVI